MGLGVGQYLSEDPSLTTCFFLGALGGGDGESRVCVIRRPRRRQTPFD